MPQSRKKKKSFSNRLRFRKAGIFLLGVLVISLSLYVLKLQSEASTFTGPAYPPGHPGWFYDKNTRTDYVFADPGSINTIHPAGSTFTARYYINTPLSSPTGEPIHVNIYLVFLKSQVQLLPGSFSCGTFAPCVPIVAMYAYPDRQSIDVCFDIPPSRLGMQNAYLFSSQFKQINTSGDNTHHTLTRWFKGECKANQHEDDLASWGVTNPDFLGFGRAGNGLGEGGVGPVEPSGFPTTNNNPSNSGNKTGDNGRSGGTGAGSGSTAATNLSNQPNSIPESSGLGEEKQPEIEPSPFFDGKLFAAGSDASEINSVNVNGIKLGYGWFYLLGGLMLSVVGGFLGWRLWQAHIRK